MSPLGFCFLFFSFFWLNKQIRNRRTRFMTSLSENMPVWEKPYFFCFFCSFLCCWSTWIPRVKWNPEHVGVVLELLCDSTNSLQVEYIQYMRVCVCICTFVWVVVFKFYPVKIINITFTGHQMWDVDRVFSWYVILFFSLPGSPKVTQEEGEKQQQQQKKQGRVTCLTLYL